MSPQGKKGRRGNPAAGASSPTTTRATSHKRLGLLVFGVLFAALFLIVAVAQGIGSPNVPADAIAVVEDAPDGTITTDEFDRALVQTAARQGIKDVPAADDPQYQVLADAAQSDLILGRWVLGEAEERGIVVSDREIDQELEKIKKQQFGSDEAFQKFLDQSGFTLAEARDRIKLQLVSDRIQSAVLPQNPEVTEDEVKAYYDDNAAQFEQPESRDVRVILTKTQQEADQALDALGSDPSPKTWDEVAKKYSIDDATKSSGGLRQGVVEGQSEPAFDDQVFSATENELVGPFKGDSGYYVIEVQKVTEAVTTPLDQAETQIRQTLVAARQQEIAQRFQTEFQNKWTARTFCAEGFRIDRCSNAEPAPDPCTKEVAESQGCDAPVPSTRPIAPGTNVAFGSTATPGLPQGPITPQSGAAALPPGLSPATGGAVPPGTAPQAAPQAAPPGG